MERSWSFFCPGFKNGLTLCGRSRLLVAHFGHYPPELRHLLPSELFGLQGMPLPELFEDRQAPEAELADFMTYGEICKMVGSAFHLPTAMAGLMSAMLSMPPGAIS